MWQLIIEKWHLSILSGFFSLVLSLISRLIPLGVNQIWGEKSSHMWWLFILYPLKFLSDLVEIKFDQDCISFVVLDLSKKLYGF